MPTPTRHGQSITPSLPQLSSGPVGSYSRGRWVGLRDLVRRRRREADIAGCQGRWLWREVCGHQGLYNEDGEQRPERMTLQEADAGRRTAQQTGVLFVYKQRHRLLLTTVLTEVGYMHNELHSVYFCVIVYECTGPCVSTHMEARSRRWMPSLVTPYQTFETGSRPEPGAQ